MKEYYIKRETTAIEALQKCEEMANIYGVKPTLNDFKNAIYNAPAADVEPVRHGEWNFDYYKGVYYCSLCNNIDTPNKYCPNCGARMDGGNK